MRQLIVEIPKFDFATFLKAFHKVAEPLSKLEETNEENGLKTLRITYVNASYPYHLGRAYEQSINSIFNNNPKIKIPTVDSRD